MPVSALLTWRSAITFALAGFLTCAASVVGAQQPELGKCTERPRVISGALFVDYLRWCVETVVDDPDIEPLSFTALETAPDGSLFATRPLTGQIMIISASDGDGLPDTMSVFAAGLTLPNGLAYHDGYLYVAGGSNIYRINDDGFVEVIVSDLPSGAGFPTGGLVVGTDERLYLAIGAPCDNCEFSEPERGAILSMALDGSDRQVVASGFRRPSDVEIYRGQLWTLDSAPFANQALALDELNLVKQGNWYGFPYCLGDDHINIPSGSSDCSSSTTPSVLFGAGAQPSSLAAYPYDSMPGTADTLIVVLSGEPSQVDFVGYRVVMLNFDENDQVLGATILLPFRIESNRQAFTPYDGGGFFWRQYITLSELGWGIYPQQPLAVAVDAKGWIYISLTGGQIVALRPANETPPWDNFYPIWTPMHPDYDPSARDNG